MLSGCSRFRVTRHAALAGWVVLFCEQFCGVNVITFYSSNIFLASGFTQVSTLTSSLDWVHLTRCPPCHCFHRQGSFPQSGFPPIVKVEETYVRRNFSYVSLHDHLLEYFGNKTCGWRLYRSMYVILLVLNTTAIDTCSFRPLCGPLFSRQRSSAGHVLCRGIPSLYP